MPSSFDNVFFSLPYHCTCVSHYRCRQPRRAAAAATTILPTVCSRINANPPKGRSQIRLQRDVASQQSKGERSNFRLVLSFQPVTHVVRRSNVGWLEQIGLKDGRA